MGKQIMGKKTPNVIKELRKYISPEELFSIMETVVNHKEDLVILLQRAFKQTDDSFDGMNQKVGKIVETMQKKWYYFAHKHNLPNRKELARLLALDSFEQAKFEHMLGNLDNAIRLYSKVLAQNDEQKIILAVNNIISIYAKNQTFIKASKFGEQILSGKDWQLDYLKKYWEAVIALHEKKQENMNKAVQDVICNAHIPSEAKHEYLDLLIQRCDEYPKKKSACILLVSLTGDPTIPTEIMSYIHYYIVTLSLALSSRLDDLQWAAKSLNDLQQLITPEHSLHIPMIMLQGNYASRRMDLEKDSDNISILWANAIEKYLSVIELCNEDFYPNYLIDAHSRLAKIYAKNGQHQQASESYKKAYDLACKIYPDDKINQHLSYTCYIVEHMKYIFQLTLDWKYNEGRQLLATISRNDCSKHNQRTYTFLEARLSVALDHDDKVKFDKLMPISLWIPNHTETVWGTHELLQLLMRKPTLLENSDMNLQIQWIQKMIQRCYSIPVHEILSNYSNKDIVKEIYETLKFTPSLELREGNFWMHKK